jgi:ribose transport system substrate-binding protein
MNKLLSRFCTVVATVAALGIGALNAQDADPDLSFLKQPPKKPLSSITIGFTENNVGVDSYQTTYEKTFKEYAKNLGVKIVVLDPQSDPVRQVSQIQDLIAQRVDVLIVWPTNAKAVVPALRQAKNAGIPVVITNSPVDVSGLPYTVAFSGPDTRGEGKIAGEMMLNAINGKGNVVIINGKPGYSTAIDREAGFLDVMKDVPGVKILDAQPADWNREKAQTIMENFLTRFGKQIDGVYAADDNMGVGALNALKAAGISGVKLVGATNFAVGYDAIKAGEYYGSVVQSPVTDAKTALETAIRVALGEEVPKTIFIDTPAITKENVDTFERPVF